MLSLLKIPRLNKFKRFKLNNNKKKIYNKYQYRKYTEEKDVNKEKTSKNEDPSLNKEHNVPPPPPPPNKPMSPNPDFKYRPTRFPIELIFGTALLVGGIYYFYKRHGDEYENQLEQQKREEEEIKKSKENDEGTVPPIISQPVIQSQETENDKETSSSSSSPLINDNSSNIIEHEQEEEKELNNYNYLTEENETSYHDDEKPSVQTQTNNNNNIEMNQTSYYDHEDNVTYEEQEDYKEKYYKLLDEFMELKEKTKVNSKDMEALKSIIKQYQDIILTTSSSMDTKKRDEYKEYKVNLIKEYNDLLLNEEVKEKKAIGLFLDNLMNTIQLYEIQRNVINLQEALDKCNEFESWIKKLEERDQWNNELSNLVLKFLRLQDRVNKYPHLPFDREFNEFKESSKNFPSLKTAFLSLPESLVSIGTPSIDVLQISYKNAFKKNLMFLSQENKIKSSIFDFQNYRKERKELYDSQMNHFSTFMKAYYHLEQKDLEKCLQELEKVKNEDKPHLLPWLDLANRNTIIQNGMSLLTTEMINLLQHNKQL